MSRLESKRLFAERFRRSRMASVRVPSTCDEAVVGSSESAVLDGHSATALTNTSKQINISEIVAFPPSIPFNEALACKHFPQSSAECFLVGQRATLTGRAGARKAQATK